MLSMSQFEQNFYAVVTKKIDEPKTQRDCQRGTHLKVFWPKVEVWWVIVVAKFWDTIKFCEPNDYFCSNYNKETESCENCGMLILKMHDYVNGNYCYFDNWNWPLVIIGKFLSV